MYILFLKYHFSLASLIGPFYIQNNHVITASYGVRADKKKKLEKINQHLKQIIWVAELKKTDECRKCIWRYWFLVKYLVHDLMKFYLLN